MPAVAPARNPFGATARRDSNPLFPSSLRGIALLPADIHSPIETNQGLLPRETSIFRASRGAVCSGCRRSSMKAPDSKKHVVIVGGGFAGLACARKLAKSDDIRVTLIDKNNYSQFLPLLYQLATAQLATDDVAASLRQSVLGHTNVEVKMVEVTAADPKTRTVTTREG